MKSPRKTKTAVVGVISVFGIALLAWIGFQFGLPLLNRGQSGRPPVESTRPPAQTQPSKPPATSPVSISAEARQAYQAGMEAFKNQEDYRLAVDEFTKAIEAAPAFAEAYMMRGISLERIDQGQAALEDLNKAIELDPKLEKAYLGRGRVFLYNMGDPERALADFDQVIKMNPEALEAYLERANVYMSWLGEPEIARGNLNRALEIDPNSLEAIRMRGELLMWNGYYEEAFPDLKRYNEHDPEDAWIWNYLGYTSYQLGKYDQAVSFYDQAVRREPNEPEFIYNQGFAYLAGEDAQAAMKNFERLILIQPDWLGAYQGAGRAYLIADRPAEALEAFSFVIEANTFDYTWPYFQEGDVFIDRSHAYQALGQNEKALADINLAIEKTDWFIAYYERGLLYKKMGELEKAAEDFRTLWDRAPDDEWRLRAEQELKALQE